MSSAAISSIAGRQSSSERGDSSYGKVSPEAVAAMDRTRARRDQQHAALILLQQARLPRRRCIADGIGVRTPARLQSRPPAAAPAAAADPSESPGRIRATKPRGTNSGNCPPPTWRAAPPPAASPAAGTIRPDRAPRPSSPPATRHTAARQFWGGQPAASRIEWSFVFIVRYLIRQTQPTILRVFAGCRQSTTTHCNIPTADQEHQPVTTYNTSDFRKGLKVQIDGVPVPDGRNELPQAGQGQRAVRVQAEEPHPRHDGRPHLPRRPDARSGRRRRVRGPVPLPPAGQRSCS